MMNTALRVYPLFVIEGDKPQIMTYTMEGKEGLKIASSKIKDRDGWSTNLTGARVLLTKLGNIDLRELSYGKNDDKYNSMVNWEALEVQQQIWAQEEGTQIETVKYSRNPLHYLWERLFTEAPMWNDDCEENFLFFIYLTEEDYQYMKKSVHQGVQLQMTPLEQLAEQALSPKLQALLKTFDILQLLSSKAFLEVKSTFIYLGFKVYGFEKWQPPRPYLHTYAIFDGLYRRRQERWLQFNPPTGEYPTNDELKSAKAVLLSGSSCSSYDTHEWIKTTEKFLVDAYNQHTHLRFLPICFGLQVIVQAFGGKVSPFEERKLNPMFYLSGNEILQMNTIELGKVKGLESLSLQSNAIINKAHGDEVTEYPDLFINIGTSKSCKNEVLLSQDHRILGFQAHPEYSNGMQQTMSLSFMAFYQKKSINELFNDETVMKRWSIGVNDRQNREICIKFIKAQF